MDVQLPENVVKVLKKFDSKGYEIYIVGGAVRDIIMGKIVSDWDFTTNAAPEEIQGIFPEGFYDNKFGTVGVKFEEFEKPFEITTFRTEEGYSDARHPDKILWGKSLDEDLARRDFTVNALALDVNLKLIDLYQGKIDIDKKLIRAVRDPGERFGEDALRMMRAVRIASELGFEIEDKTKEAIRKNSKLIHKIAKERVRDEMFKLIKSPAPDAGILLLKETGLMAEILPELEKCFGVEQKSPGRHHIYDVGTHLLMALKNCKSEDPITRFATLIHDIGKPATYKKLASGVITFYNHEMVSTKIAENIAERLKFSKDERERFTTLVRWHQFTVDERQTDSAIRRFIKNVGRENIEEMIKLRVADRLGGGARETSWRLEEFKRRVEDVQKEPFSIKDLKINGNDVMKELKIKPGPKVGELLEKIFKKVVNKEVENKKGNLLKEIENKS